VTPTGTWDGWTAEELAASWLAPGVEAYERIGSTNDRALELARSGAPLGMVVVADEQTEGRGRRGAQWSSPRGVGLWLSTVVPATPAGERLPLLVGVACARAIEEVAEHVEVGLKWPNDLFVGARKVGGILCEGIDHAVVVGIGINVNNPSGGFPGDLARSATSLEAVAGKSLVRKELADSILRHLGDLLDRSPTDPSAARELSRRDVLAGRRVRTEQEGEGVARGIDGAGRLVLERPEGTRVAIVSGSVRLLDANDPPNGRH